VASRTLAEPLAWQNSTVLQDDVGGAVAALKQEDGQDLHVIGSSELVQTLVAHDLVDEFRVIRPSGAQSESPARVIAAG
jgi:dihydrofolate reductase